MGGAIEGCYVVAGEEEIEISWWSIDQRERDSVEGYAANDEMAHVGRVERL